MLSFPKEYPFITEFSLATEIDARISTDCPQAIKRPVKEVMDSIDEVDGNIWELATVSYDRQCLTESQVGNSTSVQTSFMSMINNLRSKELCHSGQREYC